ncbi:thiamine pyrophosphate-dependent enzyme [Micromonospora sp. ATA51]|uniref:thiamine pyrophosphate-dependent enzyme n=1 Tax=Micromonospora sp. ATA51 TaxID=2806098 RepID=UPI001EE48404|nr:thiamine pyrophosphate-dependent enzyme [Micromonospora sp. ATA51]
MPGDLHKLWRSADPKAYHVEYGYSCMGYEIAGGIGVKLAAPDREVFVLVGDGSYLMLPSELVTAVAEGVKLVVVLVDNQGFASIGRLSESVGAQRLGTAYRDRAGAPLPVDLAANAASLGAEVIRATTMAELRGGSGRGEGGAPHDGRARVDGPDGGRAGRRRVVGCARRRGLGHRGGADGPGRVRGGAQGAPRAPAPVLTHVAGGHRGPGVLGTLPRCTGPGSTP